MKQKKKKQIANKPLAADPQQNGDPGEETIDAPDAFLERMYGDNSKWVVAVVLIFGCVIIYYQVSGFEFINFDDNSYVYQNANVKGGLTWENIKWAFTAFHSANWHPLTWLSHQLDCTLFSDKAGYHHLVNVFFHTLNSVLLFFTIRKLTGATWKSGLVAAIFAFHPAHVESVAWISERKDVLSTLFFILTIWFYADYVRREKKSPSYFPVIISFALGLMAKPMLVTLPFVLILLDFWPLKRFDKVSWTNLRPLLIEKLPLFALTLGSCVMTYFAQRSGGAVMALSFLPFSSRVINATLSYARYVVMLFYPADLGGWYPYPVEGFPLWQIAAAAVMFAGISVFAVWFAYRRRYFFLGWFWYVGTLVPVIGLMQVGRQSHADRYTYVPYIGLSIALVWLAAAFIEKLKINKDLVSATAIILLAGMGILCFKQVSYWRNNETFYQHTLAVTEKNYLFEQNYCQYLLERDRLDEAEVQCRNSIAHSTSPYPNSFLSLGLLQMKQKKYEDALGNFEIASRLRPRDLVSFSNFINALIALERFDDAEEKVRLLKESEFSDEEKNVYLLPLYSQVSFGFAKQGKTKKAIENAQKALAIDGTSQDQRANLGLLLYQDGRKDEALAELLTALEANPEQADLQLSVGRIYLEQGKEDKAIEYFQNALKIDPNNRTAEAYINRMKSPK